MNDRRPVILWLRRDLRLADHPALTAAVARGGPVIPVFIHDEVVEAMGDGSGAVMINGKMEDDASCKQCLVMLDLARALAERDPELADVFVSWLTHGETTDLPSCRRRLRRDRRPGL